jgi:uncharacterized Zn-finger protein
LSIGQTTLESLTDDINPPIKCSWVQRPICGRCKVFLSLHYLDEQGNIQTANERVCSHCGQVNRLD